MCGVLAPRAMDRGNGGHATGSDWERRSTAGGGRVDDEAAVGDRVGGDGLLEQAVEQ